MRTHNYDVQYIIYAKKTLVYPTDSTYFKFNPVTKLNDILIFKVVSTKQTRSNFAISRTRISILICS